MLGSDDFDGSEPVLVLAGEDTCRVSEPVRKKATESQASQAQPTMLSIITILFKHM
jgi:hypothetical protein